MLSLFILFILLGLIVLLSKSVRLGQYIYGINNFIEMRAAGLVYKVHHVKAERFIYLSNQATNKPNMLLLHGFSSDKYIWLKFAKHAHKDYNLIIPDLLGHGDIAYSVKQNYSAYEQAKYVQELIEALALQGPLTIVGNSMGGMIGAILAQQGLTSQASEMRKLVLINPAGVKSELAQQLHDQQHNPFSHSHRESVYAFYSTLMYQKPFMPPSVYAFIAEHQFLSKKAQYEKMFPEFFDPDTFIEKPIEHEGIEVVLIWGEEDKLLPMSDVALWQKFMNCQTHIMPLTGHVPMFERAKSTYQLIDNQA